MSSRFSRTSRAGGGVLLATSVLAVVGFTPVSAETGDSDQEIPGLVDSADLPGRSVLNGELRPEHGSAEGEMVLLYVWPSAEQLAKLKIGETVKSVPIGFAHVDRDGSFKIKVSDPTLAEPYESTTGDVTVQVLSVVGEEVFSETTTLSPAQLESQSTVAPELVLDASVDAVVDAAADTTVEKSCETTKVADLGDFWTYVGFGYVTDATVANMTFSYRKGASSTLGVGLSASGSAGSFTLSGTSTVATGYNAAFATTAGYKGWQAEVNYGKYKRRCVGIGDVVTTYLALPQSMTGGHRVVSLVSAPAATYCAAQPKGLTFTIDSTKATTVGAGVQSKAALGVSLTAQTGYTTTASIAFKFLKAGRLCGTSGKPGAGAPGTLLAKPAG